MQPIVPLSREQVLAQLRAMLEPATREPTRAQSGASSHPPSSTSPPLSPHMPAFEKNDYTLTPLLKKGHSYKRQVSSNDSRSTTPDPDVDECELSRSATETSTSAIAKDDEGNLWAVNQYDVIADLGSGACGTVYLAVIPGGGEVAIKAIDRSHVTDLNNCNITSEVFAMKQLQHKHIVTLHEVIDDPQEDMLFLVMDYVHGKSIGTVDVNTGMCDTVLSAEELPIFVYQISSALRHCHNRGVVHGDLKPENILFTGKRGKDLFCKLADFGVCKLLKVPSENSIDTEKHFQLGGLSRMRQATVGTPYVRAPELFEGFPPSPASDLWALGVCIFCFIYGRLPFFGDNLFDLRDNISRGVQIPQYGPPHASEWIPALQRLLDPVPQTRMTARELRLYRPPGGFSGVANEAMDISLAESKIPSQVFPPPKFGDFNPNSVIPREVGRINLDMFRLSLRERDPMSPLLKRAAVPKESPYKEDRFRQPHF